MDTLHKSAFQFDYFSDSFIAFEKDSYKYANINIPLAFLTGDILENMISTKNDYFRINAKNCKGNLDHYFVLRKNFIKEGESIIPFQYVGHRSQTELKNL